MHPPGSVVPHLAVLLICHQAEQRYFLIVCPLISLGGCLVHLAHRDGVASCTQRGGRGRQRQRCAAHGGAWRTVPAAPATPALRSCRLSRVVPTLIHHPGLLVGVKLQVAVGGGGVSRVVLLVVRNVVLLCRGLLHLSLRHELVLVGEVVGRDVGAGGTILARLLMVASVGRWPRFHAAASPCGWAGEGGPGAGVGPLTDSPSCDADKSWTSIFLALPTGRRRQPNRGGRAWDALSFAANGSKSLPERLETLTGVCVSGRWAVGGRRRRHSLLQGSQWPLRSLPKKGWDGIQTYRGGGGGAAKVDGSTGGAATPAASALAGRKREAAGTCSGSYEGQRASSRAHTRSGGYACGASSGRTGSIPAAGPAAAAAAPPPLPGPLHRLVCWPGRNSCGGASGSATVGAAAADGDPRTRGRRQRWWLGGVLLKPCMLLLLLPLREAGGGGLAKAVQATAAAAAAQRLGGTCSSSAGCRCCRCCCCCSVAGGDLLKQRKLLLPLLLLRERLGRTCSSPLHLRAGHPAPPGTPPHPYRHKLFLPCHLPPRPSPAP